MQRRFGVAHIVVTGRYHDGTPATMEGLRWTIVHEMGHALGLGGHSPNPSDAMYGFLDADTPEAQNSGGPEAGAFAPVEGLSTRDRETLRLLYEKPSGTRMSGARRAY